MYSINYYFQILFISFIYAFRRGQETRSSKSAGRGPAQLINQLVGPLEGCGATLRITNRAAGRATSTETNPECIARFSIHCKPGHMGKTSS
jgi:hypothetical protein